MSERFGLPEMAPLMADILRDPNELSQRYQQPVFMTRYAYSLPWEQQAMFAEPSWIEASTEANGLLELDAYLADAARAMESNNGDQVGLETARRLRKELRVIDAAAWGVGVRTMAKHWISRVEGSPDGTLRVFAPAGESESFVFWHVHQEIARTRPEIAEALRPFDIGDLTGPGAAQYTQKDIVIGDDSTMSGDQMGEQLDRLTKYGISRDRIELNYICAAENHLGGMHNVPLLSSWTYPALSPDRDKWVSLVGMHTSADYGFNRELSRIEGEVERIHHATGDESLRLVLPGLATVARVYKAGKSEGVKPSPLQDPGQFVTFHTAVDSYQKMFPSK